MFLDRDRLIYLGYWKLAERMRPEDFKTSSRTIKAGFSATSGVEGSFEQFSSIPSDHKMTPEAVRAFAVGEVERIDKMAINIRDAKGSSVGVWCRLQGVAAHAVRTHDDCGWMPHPPKFAFWVSEIEDNPGEVTLVFLHGTPEGNLSDHFLGGMPSMRSGSQTGALFEHLWIEERCARREGNALSEWDPSTVAERSAWIIGMSDQWQRQNIETLFRPTYDRVLDGNFQFSPLAVRSPSNERPPLVTRIIIASPLIVQSAPYRRDQAWAPSGRLQNFLAHFPQYREWMTRRALESVRGREVSNASRLLPPG